MAKKRKGKTSFQKSADVIYNLRGIEIGPRDFVFAGDIARFIEDIIEDVGYDMQKMPRGLKTAQEVEARIKAKVEIAEDLLDFLQNNISR